MHGGHKFKASKEENKKMVKGAHNDVKCQTNNNAIMMDRQHIQEHHNNENEINENYTNRPNNKSKNKAPSRLLLVLRLTYLLLVVLRIIACTFPGYIHPDEFFQGGQELFYGCNGKDGDREIRAMKAMSGTVITNSALNTIGGHTTAIGMDVVDVDVDVAVEEKDIDSSINIITESEAEEPATTFSIVRPSSSLLELPWEFQRRHAIRSIVPPMIMTLLPLKLYSFIRNQISTTARNINSNSNGNGKGFSTISGNYRTDRRENNVKEDRLSGLEIWLVPRVFMALISILTIDFVLWYILFSIATIATTDDNGATTDDNDDNDDDIRKSFHEHAMNNSDDNNRAANTKEANKDNSKNGKDCRLQIQHDDDDDDDKGAETAATVVTVVTTQMIIFASSWSTLLFLNRPFSNTLETMLLSLLLGVVIFYVNGTNPGVETSGQQQQQHQRQGRQRQQQHYYDQKGTMIPKLQSSCNNRRRGASFHDHHTISYSIGVICSLGIFTRFTFAFFAFPVVLLYLHERSIDNTRGIAFRKTKGDVNQFSFGSYTKHFIVSSAVILFGFVSFSCFIIRMDCEFYNLEGSGDNDNDNNDSESEQQRQQRQRQVFITPWNALRYNSKVSNLSDHGIHPRLTHAVVNMPMLFGPLAILFYVVFTQRLLGYVHNVVTNAKDGGGKEIINYKLKDERGRQGNNETGNDVTSIIPTSTGNVGGSAGCTRVQRFTSRTCYAMVIVGLGILSCAPHQEPRFILPLIVPLTILHSKSIVPVWGEQLVEKEGKKIRKKLRNAQTRWVLVVVWVTFNTLLLTFFGKMHQGAVIPSLLQVPLVVGNNRFTTNVSDELVDVKLPKAIIYYHTYMPPTFLLRQSQPGIRDIQRAVIGHETERRRKEECYSHGNDKDTCSNVVVESSRQTLRNKNMCEYVSTIDLKGSGIEMLLETIGSLLECHQNKDSGGSDDGDEYVYLVSPRSLIETSPRSSTSSDSKRCNFASNLSCQSQWTKFQISTEDMPEWSSTGSNFISDMALAVYYVGCKNENISK